MYLIDVGMFSTSVPEAHSSASVLCAGTGLGTRLVGGLFTTWLTAQVQLHVGNYSMLGHSQGITP